MGMSERSTIELILRRMEEEPHSGDKRVLIEAVRAALGLEYQGSLSDRFVEGYVVAIEDTVTEIYQALWPFP